MILLLSEYLAIKHFWFCTMITAFCLKNDMTELVFTLSSGMSGLHPEGNVNFNHNVLSSKNILLLFINIMFYKL